MQLSRNNPLVILYLLWESPTYKDYHKETNLCSLFWTVLLKLAMLITAAIGLTFLGIELWFEPIETLKLITLAIALVLAFVGLMWFIVVTQPPEVVRDTIQFIKGNYCPTIRLKDGE